MKRVLVADDSVAARRSIQTLLEVAGIEVVAVGNGELALARFDEVSPQMVLLDAILPGRTGYEVCALIKRDPLRAHVPVFLLTTEFEPFDERAAAEAGAEGRLVKPLGGAALAAMRDAWDRHEAAAARGPEPEAAAEPEAAEPEPAPAPRPAVPGPDAFITSTMKVSDLTGANGGAEVSDLTTDPGLRRSRQRETPLPDHVFDVEPAGAPSRAPTTDGLAAAAPEYGAAWLGEAGAAIGSVPVSDLRAAGCGCPQCGSETASGDIFCLSCGAMVLVTPAEAERLEHATFCPGCRQELMPGEVICLACGAVV